MVTKKTIAEKEMDEAIEDSEKEAKQEGNITNDHSLSTAPQNTSVALPNAFKGVDIAGLESVPMSMVAVPYVRLIQPTSQKTEDAKGNEIMPGNFMFNDTLKGVGEIGFALLRAKVGMVTFKRPEGDQTVQRLTILGCTIPENKLFILTLSPTSFSTFGRLIAQFKDAGIRQSWKFLLTLSSEKRENDKGKFYVAKFTIGEELEEKQVAELAKKSTEYGVVLDRSDIADEEYQSS